MYGRIASRREVELAPERESASRTTCDLVRLAAAAFASSLANSNLESLTVIVGMNQWYYFLKQLQYRIAFQSSGRKIGSW